jgi:hypothetical protein
MIISIGHEVLGWTTEQDVLGPNINSIRYHLFPSTIAT